MHYVTELFTPDDFTEFNCYVVIYYNHGFIGSTENTTTHTSVWMVPGTWVD